MSAVPPAHLGILAGLEFELEKPDGSPGDRTTLFIQVNGGSWGPMPVTVLEGRWRVVSWAPGDKLLLARVPNDG